MAWGVHHADSLVGVTYTSFAAAWNEHDIQAASGVNVMAAGSLLVGIVAALLVLVVFFPLLAAWTNFARRIAIEPQCCFRLYVAPESLPLIRTTNKPGQRKTTQKTQQYRASPAQWNAMRMKLGPHVPEQEVFNLLSNYGDDVVEAAKAFYGPGYHA